MAGVEQRFAYHRAVAPMLWALVSIATLELAVTHVVLAFWLPTVAAVVSLATAAGVVWLAAAIASMRRLPVLLDDERLLMRVGRIKAAAVERRMIAGLRRSWTREDIRRRDVLNLALVAYPNVVLDLREPLPGRRAITAIAHRLDDPAAFTAAVAAAVAGGSGGDG